MFFSSVLARDIWSTWTHLYRPPPQSQSRNKHPANIPQMRTELWTRGPDERLKKKKKKRAAGSLISLCELVHRKRSSPGASAVRSPCTNAHAKGSQQSLIAGNRTGLLLRTLKAGLFFLLSLNRCRLPEAKWCGWSLSYHRRCCLWGEIPISPQMRSGFNMLTCQ